jgi:hypothetical protein
MKRPRSLPLFRLSAPLAAVLLLTGAIEVSCAGDPADDDGDTPGSSRPASHAMGQWTPVAGVDTCTQAEHDEHFVVGPDGKKYPTWHAPTRTRSDSTVCSYGHDHGMDPRNFFPLIDQIKAHFAYDDNQNGTLEQSELDVSGVPFGYVAEQLDAYNTAVGTGTAGQRHQPHTAYKIVYAPGVRDRNNNGVITTAFANCYHLVALNQDTYTADAFASNLHEAIVALDCTTASGTAPYPVRLIVSGMMSFGNRGAFDAAALSSTVAQPIAVSGAQPTTQPAGATGVRRAIAANAAGANRLTDNAFAAAGAASNLGAAFSERWTAEFALVNGNNAALATVRPTVTALSPSRYYEPSVAGFVGRTIDLCYAGLNAGGGFVNDPALAATIVRQVRGNNDCNAAGAEATRTATPLANRIRFDSSTSPFRNCTREITFGNVNVDNSAGATTQYSTPFGTTTQSTRSTTSNVKQYIAAVNTAQLAAGSVELQPFTFVGANNCDATVHVPN